MAGPGKPGRPRGRQHGTASCYASGCRIFICRLAHSKQARQRRERRAEQLRRGLVTVEHGRVKTYDAYMCRCRPCCDAKSLSHVEYKARKRRGEVKRRERV